MDINTIIKLLNKKTTTIEDVLDQFKKMIDGYQQLREDFYTVHYVEQLNFNSLKPTKEELSRTSETISNDINLDTQAFVKEYVSKTTDEVLDAINSKQIKRKTAGHAFLVALLAMAEAYRPQKKN